MVPDELRTEYLIMFAFRIRSRSNNRPKIPGSTSLRFSKFNWLQGLDGTNIRGEVHPFKGQSKFQVSVVAAETSPGTLWSLQKLEMNDSLKQQLRVLRASAYDTAKKNASILSLPLLFRTNFSYVIGTVISILCISRVIPTSVERTRSGKSGDPRVGVSGERWRCALFPNWGFLVVKWKLIIP